jgi:hypothetical protein
MLACWRCRTRISRRRELDGNGRFLRGFTDSCLRSTQHLGHGVHAHACGKAACGSCDRVYGLIRVGGSGTDDDPVKPYRTRLTNSTALVLWTVDGRWGTLKSWVAEPTPAGAERGSRR